MSPSVSRRLSGAALLCLVLVVVGLGAPALALASDDPFFPDQWNLTQIGAPEAWARSTGEGVTIGIVDTGIDAAHPDLGPKIDALATCLGGPCREGSAHDGHGHGTVVAGIAAAVTGNARGVAAVAPDARLVVAKAVDDQGRASVEDINNAIRWVVDRGARVVNLSLGDPNFLIVSLLGTPLRPGIEYAWSRGAVPVLASGNENVGLLDLGSSNYGNLNAVVVGATGRDGSVAPYSSPIGSAKWGLVAPGGGGAGAGADLVSTYPGGYARAAGTSMATPHVSGALALVMAQGRSPGAAVDRLLATADRRVPCGNGCQGRLDVAAAVSDVAPVSTAAPVTAPPAPATTAPPTTAAGPTTTAGRPTTTTSTTVAPPPPDALAGNAGGGEQAFGRVTIEYAGDGGPLPVPLVVLAAVMAAGAAAAAGTVGWMRLRDGAGL
ncbi:MAG: S8 family serine peptidase [Actinomycetota bacterium]